ncbi:MAG: hypothetical protein ABIO79_15140 [Ferruginibacter sp.]
MKKISFLIAFILPALLFAQSVGINTDASQPNNSAILDIKSSSKGLLIPRLTTGERTTIPGPALGLTVFDIETASYWMYRGDLNGGWAELQHNYQNLWGVSGLNIYNKNNGNVGIGTNSPTEKLTINAAEPAINFLNSGSAKGYLQASGNNMKLGTYFNNTTGNIVFNTKAVDRMWIDENGKVGIGTSTPSGPLTIDGSNPWIEMRTGGVYKGYLWASGSDMRLGTSLDNTTGNLALQTKLLTRMLIDENGKVGIGTSTPVSALTVNAANPIVQLQNNNVDMGFVQLVDDDIKIGTNTANDFGNFIVRTNGADRLTVSSSGKVGIGTIATNYLFDVNGYSRFSDHMWLEGNLYSKNIEISQFNLTPSIQLKRTDNLITTGSLTIDDNSHLKLSKTFNGGGIIIDANTTSGTKRFYASKGNHFNFGTGLTPTGYTVSVEGKVIATDFTTSAIVNWPDYVFADKYKLKPLAEVRKFINENKHLPNIPSAAEVEKNGIQLGDMSKKLMEKVEELTLYILQLQDQIDDLKKQITVKKEN